MDNQDRVLGTIAPDGGFWPTMEQELLLRASLLEGRDAFDAWKEWESKVDIDLLDNNSRRLLPLLYWNMKAHGVDNSYVDMFKKISQSTWYKNQMLFQRMSTLLRRFHDSGIQTMILKGAPLVLLYYRDFGQRPMGDFDILIRKEHLLPAIDMLTELGWIGWKPDLESLKANPEILLSVMHATGFTDAAERKLDLHWYALFECCYNHADDDWWDAAIKVELHGVRTHALNSTDTLLHICVHGTWHLRPLLHWVADAMMVLNSAEYDIDWDRLTSHTQKRRLILPMRSALAYLRDTLNAPVPSAVLQTMQKMTISGVERLEYRIKSRPPSLTGGLLMKWFLFLRYSQLENYAALRANFIGFPSFLKHALRLDSLWQIPMYTLSKGMKRIVKAIAGK